MVHKLQEIINKRSEGIHSGIYSICSSNSFVIEAAMRKAREENMDLLLEVTPNQVNQFGGYSHMTPFDFVNYIKKTSEENNFPFEKIIFGADHLGPLIWKNEDSDIAMKKSKELVNQFVKAGFTKLHIDTSMKLKGDSDGPLQLKEIIKRSIELISVAENSSIGKELVYVLGSEVPIPGGEVTSNNLHITKANDFLETIKEYKKRLEEKGMESIFEKTIAIVVQPGVEFYKDSIKEYNREDARDLSSALSQFQDIVFEGHSTDYQTPEKLREMVSDGMAILKVGPALTFALTQAIIELEELEKKMIKEEYSNFIKNLKIEMEKNPSHWENHYEKENLEFLIKNSFLDRTRYYLETPSIKNSINIILKNLEKENPKEIIINKISEVLDDYVYAIKPRESEEIKC